VGSAAQIKAMKKVSGTLKLDLAQFRELEAIATFGSELDKVSAAQLERGYRLTELLKQNLNSPMAMNEQVAVIAAGTGGYLDDIPVDDVKRFELDLLDYLRGRHSDMLESIRVTGKMPDDGALEAAIAAFKDEFVPSEANLAVTPDDIEVGEATVSRVQAQQHLPEDEIDRETEA
jgi:F-type H+-transporting ATPase subunit alpha